MKKPYIETLFDRINGGDDVDAAHEAQEIMEMMYLSLRAARSLLMVNRIVSSKTTWDQIESAINRAAGRKP